MDYSKNNTRDKDQKQSTSKDIDNKQPDTKPTEKPATSHSK